MDCCCQHREPFWTRETATQAMHNLRAQPGWGHQLQPQCQIEWEFIWGFASKQDSLQEPKARKPKARVSRMPWYEQQYYSTKQTLVFLVYFLLPLSFSYFLLFFHMQKWRASWYLLCNPVHMSPSLGANNSTVFPPYCMPKKNQTYSVRGLLHCHSIKCPPVNSDLCW